jgi:hypothetical protein
MDQRRTHRVPSGLWVAVTRYWVGAVRGILSGGRKKRRRRRRTRTHWLWLVALALAAFVLAELIFNYL